MNSTAVCDPFLVASTLLAGLAVGVLLYRRTADPFGSSQHGPNQQDLLLIGEQMRRYQQTKAALDETEHQEDREIPAPPQCAPAINTFEQSNSTPLAATAPRSSRPTQPKASYPNGKLTICFGTQTGTAEGFAEILEKEGKKHGFDAKAVDLEDYDASTRLRHEQCVVFVMATYGEGDPTDNAVDFVKYLKNKKKDIEPNAFKNVVYAVFGLGNRQYEQFNAMGRFMDKTMEKYGARRGYHYGEGDDDEDIDGDFNEWKADLWKSLRSSLKGEQVADEEQEDAKDGEDVLSEPELEYECVEIRAPLVCDDESAGTSRKESIGSSEIKASSKHFFTSESAKVVVNRELRQLTHDGSTFHMELDLKNTRIEYQTADNAGILPENSDENVETLAKRLDYDLEQWITMTSKNSQLPFPVPCTIDTILRRYLDINSAPRREPLRQLAYYARASEEKKRLLHLVSPAGKDEYNSWVVHDERTFVDVLVHFRSIDLPLEALIQIVPFLHPRYYTISSSHLYSPQRMHLTVTVVRNQHEDERIFEGVCSNYLANLIPPQAHDKNSKKLKLNGRHPGEQGQKNPREWPRVRLFVRPSSFRLPANPKTPIIMIGPGTGIAPMRAFLQHREFQMQQLKSEAAADVDVCSLIGKSVLFFGCRREHEDYLYRDELQEFVDEGVLNELFVAFSRKDPSKKVYVQHLLQQQADQVVDLIVHHDAYVYVCGGTSMGNDVQQTLVEMLASTGTRGEATHLLKTMQQNGRYVQELWA